MLKEIYIVLGGENSKHPRCKKLIEELINKKTELLNGEIKIILSGKSWFNPHTEITEAKRMKEFLLSSTKISIPKESIILEEESMDTLGNMIYSFNKIRNLLSTVEFEKL